MRSGTVKGFDDIGDRAFSRGFRDQGSGGTWMVIFDFYPQAGLFSPQQYPLILGPDVSKGGEDVEEKSTLAWYCIKDS